eukprot:10784-Heterococcus_DN1.PRE.3
MYQSRFSAALSGDLQGCLCSVENTSEALRLSVTQNALLALHCSSMQAWEERLKRNVNPQLAGVETWAHELALPEPGCLILASPEHFTSRQEYFSQAVIFLVQHNVNGTVGFVLNRPSQFKLGGVTAGLEQFADCPLMWGGDV